MAQRDGQRAGRGPARGVRPLGTALAGVRDAVRLGAAALRHASRRAHPVVSGRLTVAGLAAPLEVLRDRHGVPHVFAASEQDVLFGQGLVHAQDRLFQMELARRLAAGRLAEVFGARALQADRLHRRLGLAGLAQRDVDAASAGDRASLEAYAEGVNAGLATLRALPPEFVLLGIRPEPWQAWHSTLVGRLLLFTFATNWETELLRAELLRLLGPDRAAAAEPAPHPSPGGPAPAGWRRTATGADAPGARARLLAAYAAAREAGVACGLPAGVGASNAYAVAPGRSRTGAPLLAADPHLAPRIPGLFHLVHLEGGGLRVAGADIPGLPGVAIGHNGALAWGLTAGLADVADCYVEQLDPDDPARYRTPEGWRRGRWRMEAIGVRGGEPVVERVLETRHGPLVGPALPGEERAIALHATPLAPGDVAGPLLALGRARRIEDFEAALDGWPSSTFNVVYAHREGFVGYRLVGRVQRRELGEGLLPRAGWLSSGPPQPLDPAALPRRADPDSGVVISANEAPGGPLELGEEWCESWRAERIAELLGERERHDVASLAAIQLDLHSEPMARLRDLLLAAGAPPPGSVVRAMLEGWDGRLLASSAAAAVVESAFIEVARSVASRAAGPAAPIVLGRGLDGGQPHSSFHYRAQGWLLDLLERPRPPLVRDEADRDRLLRAASGRAIAALGARLGSDPAAWSWGALHHRRLPHALAAAPLLGRLWSRGPFPAGGDVNSVSQAGYSLADGPGAAAQVPVYRQVIDLDDPDRSLALLPAGVSGIPGHPRYDDCVEEMLAGRFRPLLFSRRAVEAALESRLELAPVPSPQGGRRRSVEEPR
ncbi:MAG: penicillin acylase family protein [Chloroflexi bacterium]|nr:penicillin acylase family protein [Chloroflexota bacterium]